MQMDEGLDTGAMLLKAHCPIEPTETGGSLHDKLIQVGQPALLEVVEQLANGSASPEQQDDSLSNYAAKISKTDAIIDWQQPAEQLALKIRAFNPFPGCYGTLNEQRVKIWQAQASSGQGAAGTILSADRSGIKVACGEGALILTHIQLPSAKAMRVADVMNAKADWFQPGMQFGAAS
jgi:methionyl-tRNA formyltransferase